MGLRHLALSACLAVLTIGCGGLGGGSIPDPSPPTQALAAWSDFPADRNPRPILMLDRPPRYTGFTSGAGKIAAFCNKYRLAFQQPWAAPATASATSADGKKATYQAMSAADAYSAMASAPTGMRSSECASVPALEVTRVRLGLAGFQTDRGTAQMSAWLFTVTGSTGDVAFPALAPSAFWVRSFESGWGNGGATVSADGRILTYGFTGGECDAGYKFAVGESKSAVAVVVAAIPKYGPMQACSAVGIFRTITVPMAGPLGGRVLVDEKGRAESACPAGVSSC